MGKDLNGQELGKYFSQTKDGLYMYRVRTISNTTIIRAKTLSKLIEKVNNNKPKKCKKNSTKKEYSPFSCVYFITDGEYVKIGVSEDVNHRMTTLQTGNPKKLKILDKIYTSHPYELEKALHMIFKHKRIQKEWFDIISIFGDIDDE